MESANRKIVVALASALGLSLLIIAFLMGRLSAQPAVVSLAPSTSNPTTPLPAASTVREPPTPSLETASPAPAGSPIQGIASTPASIATVMEASPERKRIAAYLAELDGIEDMGAGDPQAFASSMMQSLSSGDFTEFDRLLEKARNQKQRLLAIEPPPACIEHHRLARTLSADSVAMLERLKAALMKGDSLALMSIASDGRALETQANQLKALSETLRRQAGA